MSAEDHELVIVWEHVDSHGRRSLSPWYYGLQKASRARFDAALDKVKLWGLDQAEASKVITPVSKQQKTKKNRAGHALLYELRVHANPQLRPILCRGPVDRQREITFLAPATERGDRLEPKNAVEVAIKRYQEVANDPRTHRRRFPSDSDDGDGGDP
jgi:hypothetical protein